jgi:DNA invertase Pin-like site-specific DNA recombinase
MNQLLESKALSTVAIYTRSASEHGTTVEHQRTICFEAASRKGWTVLADFVITDSGVSGRTVQGRHRLETLIDLAMSGRATFAGILIDDLSRLGRSTTDVLILLQRLADAGVFVYIVSRDLDSREFQAILS